MKRDQLFPSKYLKAADLNGKPIELEIRDAPTETLKNPDGVEQEKCVLYFTKGKKGLVLNLTNFDAVAEIAGGDDTDLWPGLRIEVYPTKTELRGKSVDCIRIRRPQQAILSVPPAAKAPPPAAKPSLRDELDDEIPW
jgi:hypothetical protein